jgi:Cu/Ag efflux pump CusA
MAVVILSGLVSSTILNLLLLPTLLHKFGHFPAPGESPHPLPAPEP